MDSTDSSSIEKIFQDKGTGSDKLKIIKTINYPIGPYEVFVELDEDNKFIGIKEIKINKDFRKFYQRMPKGFHDVKKYYE